MTDDELVTVFQTTQPLQIGMVKSALAEADIPFLAVNDVVSSVLPVDGMEVVGFQVLQRDAERARRVLLDLGFK